MSTYFSPGGSGGSRRRRSDSRSSAAGRRPRAVGVGRRVGDLRLDALLRFDLEKLGGLQPPLAGADFAGVGDVARLEGEAVQHRRDLRVRVLAFDLDVDAADAVAVAFLDVVDDVELARLFEEAVVGLDLGEDVALAAVLVAELLQIEVLLVLVERLVAEQLDLLASGRPLSNLRLPRNEMLRTEYRGPSLITKVIVTQFCFSLNSRLAADAGVKVAEAAVVRGQFVDVVVELLAVELAGEEVEIGRVRFDERLQPRPTRRRCCRRS